MSDEVLEDDLLDMAVALVDLRQGLERGDPLLLGLADPDQDSARERDLQLAGELDRFETPRRVLGRGAGVDGLHQALGNRLEHQALGGGDLPQAAEVLTRENAEVRVGKHAALERPFARPCDIRGEVVVAPTAEPLGNVRVHLRPLAGEHEQLLAVAP
jgi:hypothetical protein